MHTKCVHYTHTNVKITYTPTDQMYALYTHTSNVYIIHTHTHTHRYREIESELSSE